MDTDSFIVYFKTEDVYEDIANDVEKRLDTSNFKVNRPLPTRTNEKVIGLMKDKLGGKITTKFAALTPKTYSYLTVDGKNGQKGKRYKEVCNKKMLKFNDYKDCLLSNEIY